jgi:hypothetical protein
MKQAMGDRCVERGATVKDGMMNEELSGEREVEDKSILAILKKKIG